MSGDVPHELTSNKQAEVISLARNQFRGEMGSFANASSLNTLSVYGQYLKGQYPCVVMLRADQESVQVV